MDKKHFRCFGQGAEAQERFGVRVHVYGAKKDKSGLAATLAHQEASHYVASCSLS